MNYVNGALNLVVQSIWSGHRSLTLIWGSELVIIWTWAHNQNPIINSLQNADCTNLNTVLKFSVKTAAMVQQKTAKNNTATCFKAAKYPAQILSPQ